MHTEKCFILMIESFAGCFHLLIVLTLGLFQVMPRTLEELGPRSLYPKDEGRASKLSSWNSCPLSRQLLRSDSKSWLRYFTAWELDPIPCDFSRSCWSFDAIPDIFERFLNRLYCFDRLPECVCAVRQALCCMFSSTGSTPFIVHTRQSADSPASSSTLQLPLIDGP